MLCGTGPDNHFRAELLSQDADGITFRVNGEKLFLPALGAHHLVSAAMSVAIASEIGMSVDAIAAGFRKFQPVPGRCERIETGAWTIIDDTYNASPLSMQAACRLLHGWSGPGRRILVLGDMLELGIEAPRFHRELGRTIAEARIDFLIAHGEFAEDMAEEA
jgi:UDP-N-acetylmuramoyl-tripeptide--D-alanyl-D-alanine ligase